MHILRHTTCMMTLTRIYMNPAAFSSAVTCKFFSLHLNHAKFLKGPPYTEFILGIIEYIVTGQKLLYVPQILNGVVNYATY